MILKFGKKIITENSKTYFIADIGANHDGSLLRAKKLIRLCAKSGADAVKFQNYKANTIVSDYGFKKIENNPSKVGQKVFMKFIKMQA